MQVKKFEAPTIQEAIDTVKRELGPDAIILQTRQNKKAFGLLSKPSFEITAAISEKSLYKKEYYEKRLPQKSVEALQKMPAGKQSEILNNYFDKKLEQMAVKTKDKVSLNSNIAAAKAQKNKKLTAVRYADIIDDKKEKQETSIKTTYNNKKIIEEKKKVDESWIRSVRKETEQMRNKDAYLNIEDEGALVEKGGGDLAEELHKIKKMILDIQKGNVSNEDNTTGAQTLIAKSKLSTQELQDAFEQLIMAGMDKRFAYSLIKKVGFELLSEETANADVVLDQLAKEIMESTEVVQILENIGKSNGPTMIALIGPTGVGKTTTIAKLASDAILKKDLKVGLINVDCYKIAAVDQLSTYAKILNIPFRAASSAVELKSAVSDFRNLDLILLDTTGRSPKDAESLYEMEELLSCIPGIRRELVLSSTTRDAELYDTGKRFSMFKPESVIFSKLDEATFFGALYNSSQKFKLPLSYFTTGQRVPEDMEEATRERLVSLIMDL